MSLGGTERSSPRLPPVARQEGILFLEHVLGVLPPQDMPFQKGYGVALYELELALGPTDKPGPEAVGETIAEGEMGTPSDHQEILGR